MQKRSEFKVRTMNVYCFCMIARSKNCRLKHKLEAIYIVRGPNLEGSGKFSA